MATLRELGGRVGRDDPRAGWLRNGKLCQGTPKKASDAVESLGGQTLHAVAESEMIKTRNPAAAGPLQADDGRSGRTGTKMRIYLRLLCLLAAFQLIAIRAVAAERPNVLLILVDDLKYHVYPKRKLGRAIRTERYRLVEWKSIGGQDTPEFELYDYQEAPLETRNLAASRPNVVDALRQTLAMYPQPVSRKARRRSAERRERIVDPAEPAPDFTK